MACNSWRLASVLSAGLWLASSIAGASTISVSTDVLLPAAVSGRVAVTAGSASNEVNYVGFIGNGADPTAVQYDFAIATTNVGNNIYNGAGAAARGPSQGIQVNSYGPLGDAADPSNTNIYLPGQNSTVNNPGFGAHANWVVTLNLDTIRTDHFSPGAALELTGLFGAWGNIGNSAGGVLQGEVLLDGTRIDSMSPTSFSSAGNQSFDLILPGTGHELSFFILNSPDASLWDDGIYENVNLATVVPEPGSMALLALGAVGLLWARRRKA